MSKMRALQVREGSVMDGRVDPICLHVQASVVEQTVGPPPGVQQRRQEQREEVACEGLEE